MVKSHRPDEQGVRQIAEGDPSGHATARGTTSVQSDRDEEGHRLRQRDTPPRRDVLLVVLYHDGIEESYDVPLNTNLMASNRDGFFYIQVEGGGQIVLNDETVDRIKAGNVDLIDTEETSDNEQ
jgi:hypothetical protein